MKKHKKLFWGLGAVVVLLIAVLVLNGATEVEAVRAAKGEIQRTVVENGTVDSKSGHDLYTAAGGTVTALPLQVGQPVQKGAVIVVLDNPDIALQISSTKTQLAQTASIVASQQGALSGVGLELNAAQMNLEKIEKLYGFGGASQRDYDDARLTVQKLQNTAQELKESLDAARQQETSLADALRLAEISRDDLTVKSPIDGKLMYLNCEVGQVIMPGAVIAGVAVSGELEVKVDVLSDDIAEVAEGQSVSITAPVMGDAVLTGQVIQIYPQAEEKLSALGVIQRRVPVIISLGEVQNLKPGYEVRAEINTVSKEDVLVLPRAAIRTNLENRQEVMAVVNNKIAIRTVETGIFDSNNIEIIKGIAADELVVKDAGATLAAGTKVKIKQ